MGTNFDFLKENTTFESFADQAIEAEKSMAISYATVAILCRRALELSVRWLYSYDCSLILPYRDNLSSLIHEYSFRNTIEPRLFPMLRYIVQLGNNAVHTNQQIMRDEAIIALRDLFEFCKWIDYCYGDEYEDVTYDESLLEDGSEERVRPEELQDLYDRLSSKDQKLEEIRKQNSVLMAQMEQLRQQNVQARTYQVDSMSEALTRKKYIDVLIKDAGWVIGRDCLVEVEVTGMPNSTGLGYADYVLYGDNGLPLAVIEAKKTSVDPIVGSQQAKLYADCLQNQYTQRPLIFTTNGFDIEFTDDYNNFPKRTVSGIFSKEELQINVDRRVSRKSLTSIEINDEITNRPYQKEAVIACCDSIEKKHRKELIVQATGSGKTRVSISLVDVLRKHNYVKNILFLADRTALVKQAKKNYNNLLPDLTSCNLLDNKDDPEQSRMVFSTYPTMMNAIDETKRKDGRKLFTPAHFDLIIVDESHRSIYKRYQDIFHYFDAMLLGMTATPKNEIDRNTYSVFDLERGVPTYAYELDQAVKEGYLADYSTLEYKTKIMEDGLHYDELSDEEKERFENTFEDDPLIDKEVSNSAVNKWLFNQDTIDIVLKELMEKGLKVEGGDKLGKTIIFAKNSRHASAIVNRFHTIFPEYGESYIKQIDYSIKYVDTLIDDFSTKEKMPQIAVSVDMLDTGVDIPEILNLVFFKKVRSYSKFWQMIGRGTRLCKDLFGAGQDKEKFLIFDFCNNFEFFRAESHGIEGKIGESLCEKIFNCKVNIIRELQAPKYITDEDFNEYRLHLIDELNQKVISLNDASFRVKLHYKYVETYRDKNIWNHLETVEVSDLKEHIAPLIVPEKENEMARRFDHLMLSIELAELQSKNASKNKMIVSNTAAILSTYYGVPQVKGQKYIIEKVQDESFWDDANILDMESVREALRDLIQYIEKEKQKIYYVDFSDNIISEKEGESIHQQNDLKNYRKKVEYYLNEHRNSLVVYKLRQNKKLTREEFDELERILWQELGSKEDYQKEYGDTPVGRLVRQIVGVDREAVNEAFSRFLDEQKLNINQIRFVRLLIDYIVANGNIEDNRVLMEEPFKSCGAITVLFKNDMQIAKDILDVTAEIRKNSEEIA